jgi:uncharacterized protein
VKTKTLFQDKELLSTLIFTVVCWGVLSMTGIEYAETNAKLSIDVLIASIFVMPVLEELAFRGFIQQNLAKTELGKVKFYKLTTSNLITSFLFAGWHIFYHPAILSIATFFPSIILGYFLEKYESLKPCFFLHIFFNLGYFFIL